MRVVGLTGGIACGKSTVTKILVEEGFKVIDCDLIARQVVEPGTAGLKQIVEVFGEDILFENGTLNRKKLGQIVFQGNNENADKAKEADEKRRQLVAITGPAIFKAIFWELLICFLKGTPIVVIDAPTLYESKSLLPMCHSVVVVAASEDTQVSRITKRDKCSKEDAMNRIKSQMPVSEKVKQAKFVIYNEGTMGDLRGKTLKVIDELKWMGTYSLAILVSLPGFCFVLGVYLLVGRIMYPRL